MNAPLLRKVVLELPADAFAEHPAPDTLQAWAYWIEDGGGEYRALLSRDELAPGDKRWHVSISGEDDVPPWVVLAAIGHDLRPGVPLAVGVPPRSWWINLHPHVLHLWELDDENLIEQWRLEGRGDTPT